jgi:hypothetical protein
MFLECITITAMMVLMKCHHTLAKWGMVEEWQGWGEGAEMDVDTCENVI